MICGVYHHILYIRVTKQLFCIKKKQKETCENRLSYKNGTLQTMKISEHLKKKTYMFNILQF